MCIRDRIIHALGPFDVGQGAVVADGRAIAIEAAEGTDKMLARVAQIGEGGILVKCPKPGQERRIDLPTIGPLTVKNALEAGLQGIAVEVGGALIIDKDEVLRRADEAALFVFGFEKPEPGGQ